MTPESPLTLVTGAAGFIGRALVAALRQPGTGPAELLLTDRHRVAGFQGDEPAAPGDGAAFPMAKTASRLGDAVSQVAASAFLPGDITDPGLQGRLFERPVSRLFHLAGIVSGAAQADFDLGRRVNLAATQALLERCRQQVESGGPLVRIVYASSIAVFGAPLPAHIDDNTPASPILSYGVHKHVIELLIDDYTRRGFVDGRALRLPGVVVRPPMGNGALSGFNSDLIREPLAGRRYDCPVGPQATIWLCSLPRVIDNLVRMAEVPGARLGARRTVNAPALAVSVEQVVAALSRIDPAAAARVVFAPTPAPELQAQFGAWPLDCAFDRAVALGLQADPDLDTLLCAGIGSLR